jgi:hypothetical protein
MDRWPLSAVFLLNLGIEFVGQFLGRVGIKHL